MEGVHLRLGEGPTAGRRREPKNMCLKRCAYNEYLLCMLSQDTHIIKNSCFPYTIVQVLPEN